MDFKGAIEEYIQNEQVIDLHANNLTQIARLSGDNLEGNCFTIHQTAQRDEQLVGKRINLFRAAKHGNKILELGFNAGHSALLLLLGCNSTTEIDFIDIGGHGYIFPCIEYIQQIRPSIPTHFYLGDSRNILPTWILKEKKQDQYDVIHMDGGHSDICVVNDLLCLLHLCKPGGWIIVDDAESFILEEVKRYVKLGLVKVVDGQLETKVYPHLIIEKI